MNITEQTIEQLAELRKEHVEADIIALLSSRLDVPVEKATDMYYRSDLARQVNDGSYDIQALDATCLVDDLMRYELDAGKWHPTQRH